TACEIPHAGRTHEGTNSITTTSFRVPSDAALSFWQKRLDEYSVEHESIQIRFGRQTIRFRDFEGQRLMLVSDETNQEVSGGRPYTHKEIPQDMGITGLGPVVFTVADPQTTISFLTDIFNLRYVGSYSSDADRQEEIVVYAMGEGGTGAEVHIQKRDDLPRERPGRGSMHHVAFRVKTEDELKQWIEM